MAVLYIGNYEGLGLLALNLHPQTSQIYLLCNSRVVLVWHIQAQKCLQINSKPLYLTVLKC